MRNKIIVAFSITGILAGLVGAREDVHHVIAPQ